MTYPYFYHIVRQEIPCAFLEKNYYGEMTVVYRPVEFISFSVTLPTIDPLNIPSVPVSYGPKVVKK